MSDQHAILSPSSAHRWLQCPASAPLESLLPKDEGSDASKQGTAAHELAEICLREGREPDEFLDQKMSNGVAVDQEMVGHISDYVDNIRWASEGEFLSVEAKFSIHHITGEKMKDGDDAKGTVDAVIVRENCLEVHDLKYGYGRVYPKENPQLILYALGAYQVYGDVFDIKEVSLFIHQPRTCDVPLCWTISLEELLAYTDVFKEKAELIWSNWDELVKDPMNPPMELFNPSAEACKFCKLRQLGNRCPKVEALAREALMDLEDAPVNEKGVKDFRQGMTAERASWILETAPIVDMWSKAAQSAVFEYAMAGGDVPGHKIVRGRPGNRVWKDVSEVDKALSGTLTQAERYETKLLSPPKVEKLIKKAHPKVWSNVQELIDRPEGKLSLVPQEDPKPAVDMVGEAKKALAYFDNVVEEGGV